MTRFSVVIPTLGRSDALEETLRALARCDPPPEELIVVDGEAGGPGASLLDEIEDVPFPMRWVVTEPGLTLQRNHSLTECTGDVVVFFDDDVEMPRDTFAWLRAPFEDPSIVGVTGRIVEPGGNRFPAKESRLRRLLFGGGAEGTFTRFGYPRRAIDLHQEQDVEFMQGCFMAARLETARAVRFDEELPGYGLTEDEDFSCRLGRAGRIRYLPQIAVFHKNLGFLSKDLRKLGRQVVVNRAYLFRKNFRRTPLARLQFGVFIFVLIAHRAINKEWAGVRGLIEGCVAVLRGRRDVPSA